MPQTRALVISLKPRFADPIYKSLKRFEFRRVCPSLSAPIQAYIYESYPVKKVTGTMELLETIHGSVPNLLALPDAFDPCIPAYAGYLEGATRPGALRIGRVKKWGEPRALAQVAPMLKRPPQSYCYIAP